MSFSLKEEIDDSSLVRDCLCQNPIGIKGGDFEVEVKDFREGHECVRCSDMLAYARKHGIYTGLRHLEALLRESKKISAKYRQQRFYILSNEEWRYNSQPEIGFIFYIGWDRHRKRWVLGKIAINSALDSKCRILVYK